MRPDASRACGAHRAELWRSLCRPRAANAARGAATPGEEIGGGVGAGRELIAERAQASLGRDAE